MGNIKAIILAAGLGTRLGNQGKIIPKCLINVNGKNLLQRKVDLLKKHGIKDIAIVIGAKGDCWTQENVRRIEEICENTITNFDNTNTNNSYSLSLALNKIENPESDILIMDGDLLLDEETLKNILNSEHKTLILSEMAKKEDSPGNKVMTDEKGRAVAVGRELNPDRSYFPWHIYSACVKLSQENFESFKQECNKETYYNKDIGFLLNSCCQKFPIYSISPNSKWANINNQEDLRLIENIISEEDKEGNILITGASGFLGKKLFDKLSKKYNIYGTYSSNKKSGEFLYLDITDMALIVNIIKRTNPKVIIHTSALCDADFCEKNRELAYNINVQGTQNIINICKQNDIKLVFLSSDYVYDGDNPPYTEESIARPVNYYGETKLICEKLIKEKLKDYIILRPTILYGFNDEEDKDTFVGKVIKKLRTGKEVSVDNDVMKYPLIIDDLVNFIDILLKEDAKGSFNIGSEEGFTRYGWAKKIAEIFNLDSKLIKSEKTENIAKKPNNVLYDLSKLKRYSIKIRGLKEGLNMMKNQESCMFRMIYATRPDKNIMGESVALFRVNVGKEIAKEQPINADIVIGIPESGSYGAVGYAEESQIPFHFGIIKDEYSRRTLLYEHPKLRSEKLREKLTVVPEIIKGKDVIVIDEAIASGKTLTVAINKLKEAGVKKIHVRIPSPLMLFNCKNNILEENAELIARKFSVINTTKDVVEEELRKYFGVDSLKFLSIEGFLKCCRNPNTNFCVECFKGKFYNNKNYDNYR